MKKIEAFIRHEALEAIHDRLATMGLPSMSVTEVKGSGRQKGFTESYRGAKTTIFLRPKLKLEMVLDDADVDAAGEGIAGAGFYNAGQDCTAATRVIATPGVYDALVEKLVSEAQAKTVGGLDVADADLGPVNSAAQLERVQGMLARATGAKVLTGGAQEGSKGYFFQPTIITGVAQHDEIVQQEIFGPAITVQRAGNTDEALAWGANLVIAHHPVLFRPVQKLTAATSEGAMILKLIAGGVAVYSPHTAFDSAATGINAMLASQLGLLDTKPLRPSAGDTAIGGGRYGRLKSPVPLNVFLESVARKLNTRGLQYVGDRERRVATVAETRQRLGLRERAALA